MENKNKPAQKDAKSVQEKYIEMQMLAQQMQHTDKQMQAIQQQIEELIMTKDAINDLAESSPGKEMLVPLSSGIFVKTELKDNRELVINVGSNIAVARSIPDAKKLVDEQIFEIDKFNKDLAANREKLIAKIKDLQKQMENLVA